MEESEEEDSFCIKDFEDVEIGFDSSFGIGDYIDLDYLKNFFNKGPDLLNELTEDDRSELLGIFQRLRRDGKFLYIWSKSNYLLGDRNVANILKNNNGFDILSDRMNPDVRKLKNLLPLSQQIYIKFKDGFMFAMVRHSSNKYYFFFYFLIILKVGL